LKAAYNGTNARFTGATLRGRWSFFEVGNSPACERDPASEKPEAAAKLVAFNKKWWDTFYPKMAPPSVAKAAPDFTKKGQPEK
jgi:hypothetical protein